MYVVLTIDLIFAVWVNADTSVEFLKSNIVTKEFYLSLTVCHFPKLSVVCFFVKHFCRKLLKSKDTYSS